MPCTNQIRQVPDPVPSAARFAVRTALTTHYASTGFCRAGVKQPGGWVRRLSRLGPLDGDAVYRMGGETLSGIATVKMPADELASNA